MSKTFRIVNDDMSDGYHTFDELYEHRCLLFLNLVLLAGNGYWKREHFAGWDCVYWESPYGQISYHVPDRLRELYEGKLREVNSDQKDPFDGHTTEDVIRRLRSTAKARSKKESGERK